MAAFGVQVTCRPHHIADCDAAEDVKKMMLMSSSSCTTAVDKQSESSDVTLQRAVSLPAPAQSIQHGAVRVRFCHARRHEVGKVPVK